MKIDCFIMNPPYSAAEKGGLGVGGSKIHLCQQVMKQLENQRVVCICGMSGAFELKHKITFFEKQGCDIFENANVYTYIWTINDKKPLLYKDIHSLKRVKKSKYFFLHTTSSTVPEIKTENKSEVNRVYVDVENDEEMNKINEFLKQNYTPYKDWFYGICKPMWCIANILYNSKWRDRFVK